LLLDAAVLAILVGLVGGGRLRRLSSLDLRAPWIFVIAAAIQVGLTLAWVRGWAAVEHWGPLVYVMSFGILLVGLWMNRRITGLWLVAAGVLLNTLVIGANGGSMPVDRNLSVRAGNESLVGALDSGEYPSHKPAGPGTRLRFLGDVVPLPLLIPRPRFMCPGSIGDIFVTAGACWLILSGMGAFGLRARRSSKPNGEA